jgi:hypothetical protein
MSQSGSIVTIERDSAPRLIYCGDGFLRERLPVGTRVLYPPSPLPALEDFEGSLRRALEQPNGCDPLCARLRPGMRVTIALDDITQPLPPVGGRDVRQRVLEVLLPLLAEQGVDDVEIVIAIGLHRRMTGPEIREIVGSRVYRATWPDRLYNHDAEDPEGIVELGYTDSGHPVAINRRAAESDLVIYISLPLGPVSGGRKSVGVGLGTYRTIRAHHTAGVLRETESYMEPGRSALHAGIDEVGRIIGEHVDILQIEVVLDTHMFGPALEFLGKNEDAHTAVDRVKVESMLLAFRAMPKALRRRALRATRSAYNPIAVHVGATDLAHADTVATQRRQQVIEVNGQSDVVIHGIPYISPYSVNSYPNPLLVQVMGMGYFFNFHRGTPLLRRGGTLILCHPCTNEFDRAQHPSYVEFFARLLPQTRDAAMLEDKHEEEFATRPEYVRAYRTGRAYHGAHPFFMWYWGERCRQWAGRVILAYAQDAHVAETLGWEPAADLGEALAMAQGGQSGSPTVSLLHPTPHFICDVRV